MIGLDTNIVLRYLLQADPKQTRQANHVIDRRLSDENPGFISLVTVLEVVWVRRSLFKRTPAQIAAHLAKLLTADTLRVQNEQQVFEAVFFDRRAARLPHFRLIP